MTVAQTEEKQECGNCEDWLPIMGDPRVGIVMVAACKSEDEQSYRGILTAGFCSCPAWRKRQQKVIAIPKNKLVN